MPRVESTLERTCDVAFGTAGSTWWVRFPNGSVIDGIAAETIGELVNEIKNLYANGVTEGMTAVLEVVHDIVNGKNPRDGSDLE